jgi:hypothetical protein
MGRGGLRSAACTFPACTLAAGGRVRGGQVSARRAGEGTATAEVAGREDVAHGLARGRVRPRGQGRGGARARRRGSGGGAVRE